MHACAVTTTTPNANSGHETMLVLGYNSFRDKNKPILTSRNELVTLLQKTLLHNPQFLLLDTD